MYNFLRVCQVVPRLQVADTDFNTSEIIAKLSECEAKQADVVLLPELAVTGYTCGDLFFQRALQSGALNGINRILQATADYSFTVIVGAPLVIGNVIYNCALVIHSGKLCGIVPKTYIPNYGEFSEKRVFASAKKLAVNELSCREIGIDGDYTVPVGNNLVFDFNSLYKFGVEICADLLAPTPPSTALALGGAEVIFNPSASNEIVAKRDCRRLLVAAQSKKLACAYVYTSSGEDESTTDLVFSGHSLVAENGTVIAENSKVIDGNYISTCDIDLDKLRSARAASTLFTDCVDFDSIRGVIITSDCGMRADGDYHPNLKSPFIPEDKNERTARCMDIFNMQVAGLKKRLSVTGARPVIGISGGLDSTLALLVCIEAVRTLNRPASDVVGITMPCFGTSSRTYNNSVELIKTLGASFEEINISNACIGHFADIGHDSAVHDATYENSQARERTQVLMDYAGRVGGFVVGTGDLSELALGWCTYNGDHMSMYGVNSGIPKTMLGCIIDTLIEKNIFEQSNGVLRDVLNTPISPELLPPDEQGKISQQTEDIVGPYVLHDYFLYYVLRYGFAPDKIYYLACKAFCDEYDSETVLKWLRTFYRRFFSQQFKRNCLPDGVKIGSVGLSARGNWHMPSDASARAWLNSLDKL